VISRRGDLGEDVVVRPLQAGELAELRRVRALSSDGGKVAFRPRHHGDDTALLSLRSGESHDYVAVVGGELVGAGSVSFSRVADRDRVIGLAWLSGLVVTPAWRGRGIARRLTMARLDAVSDRDGPHVVAAAVQAGNGASMANAMRWADRILGTVQVTPVRAPHRAPGAASGVSIRPVATADLAAVAAGIRMAAKELSLAPVVDADDLARWLDVRVGVGGEALRSYTVAVDATGTVVAGLGLEHEYKLISMEVTRMPALLAAANVVVRVVPRNKLMRNINVRFAWFRPGHQAAAQLLWRQVRWEVRDYATSVVRLVDPTGPLARALPAARWLPSTTLQIVIRDPAGSALAALPIGAVV